MTQLTYARKCDTCGAGMNEGYLIFWNEATYCSDECLHEHVSAKKYAKMHNADEACYTEWEEDEHEYIEIDGVLEAL